MGLGLGPQGFSLKELCARPPSYENWYVKQTAARITLVSLNKLEYACAGNWTVI